MKKLISIFTLGFVLLAGIALAGTDGKVGQTPQDAFVSSIATNGTVWAFVDASGTGGAPTMATITYTQANTAHNGSTGFAIAKATVAAGAGNGTATNGGYAALGAGSQAGSRAVDLLDLDGMTQASGELLANGTMTHMCILYPTGTEILWCLPLTTNKTVTDYTTETWDYDGEVDGVEIRTITAAQ